MYKDKYFTVQRCINRFLPRDTSRMRATLTWRVCAILYLYCTFTPLSPNAHIAQWQDAPALCHRSWVRIPWWCITFFIFFYLLCFLSHFLLCYCHLFSLTSISVIIYICWPYESFISMQHTGRYDFLISCLSACLRLNCLSALCIWYYE